MQTKKPVPKVVFWNEVYGRITKWRKNNERYFNETVIRSRCSFWTSDQKMES